MKAYIAVREECEQAIKESGLNSTILRPWYVLGPGHRWPYLLLPMYWLMERVPATRETALRLGLVTLPQMLNALLAAVETPAKESEFWMCRRSGDNKRFNAGSDSRKLPFR